MGGPLIYDVGEDSADERRKGHLHPTDISMAGDFNLLPPSLFQEGV